MRNTIHGISRLFVGLILLASAAFLLTPAMLAQGGPAGAWGGRGGGFGPGGFGHRGSARVVTNAPYTAQAVTATTQTLSNGTTINRQTTVSVARDASGRTMRSQTFTSGPQSGATIVSIFDPVSNERIEYNTKTQRARVFVLPQSSASGTNAGSAPRPHRVRFRSSNVSTQTRSLGPETINGVPAQGTQITRTIAAGAFGNDKPLVSTDVEWYSTDLQMVVQSTRTDPRSGQTTYTLNNLQTRDPDPSLFQVPAGFQTKTVNLPSRSSGQ